MRKLPISLLHVFSGLYVITFFYHLYLGLPITRRYIWLAIYFLLGVAFLATSQRWKWLPLPLLLVYFFAPLPGTLLMGYIAFANIHEASKPIDEPVESISTAPPNPFLIHISDSHILGPEESQTREGKPRDLDTLRKLGAEIIRLRPRYLFITGDLTDKGKDTEWDVAEQILLRPARQAGIKIFIAPGNHDLQPAFFGVSRASSPRERAAILARRLLEKQVDTGLEFNSINRGNLTSLLSWKPTDEEVAKKSDKDYMICVQNAPPDQHTWAKGCELATTPEETRKSLLISHAQRACLDWYPLLHHDAETQSSIVVLCSIGLSSSSLGDQAIGSFGSDQLKRLSEAFNQIPADAKHVFIMLHHPVVRRWDDTYAVPKRWLHKEDWLQSPLYNYALLNHESKEARDVVDQIVEAMEKHPQSMFLQLYGHRHQRSLSAIRTERGVLGLSEAPAFGEGNDLGFRGCYLGKDTNRLECKWLKL